MTDEAPLTPPPVDETPSPATAPQVVVPFGDVPLSKLELSQHYLGLHPFLLIEAKLDEPVPGDEDDDGKRLHVTAGGGAEPGVLALLYVVSLPAAENPLTAAVKAMIDAYPAAAMMHESLEAFAEYVGFPMPGTDS